MLHHSMECQLLSHDNVANGSRTPVQSPLSAKSLPLSFRPHHVRLLSFRATSLISCLLVFWLLALCQASAQTDTVDVTSDAPPKIGHLNEVVNTAVVSGTLSKIVFRLEPHGYYVLTGTITVPAGEHLTIVAQEPGRTQASGPPQIVWADTIDSWSPGYNFRCYGDITLKNLWLLYAQTNGQLMGVSLQIEDSPDTVKGQIAEFDGVIFDRSGIPANASGAVGITAKHFRGLFRNCYFKNCVDELFRYWGRALSFPFNSEGWHSDSVTFENCTFANLGYVYEQESGNFADFVKFNHCTFLNVVMFPLESGWWRRLAVTNCVFVNTHMFGHVPELSLGGDPYGGTIWIDSVSQFGYIVPFTDQDRHILFANNSYFIETWLRNWMKENPATEIYRTTGDTDKIPVPQPIMNPRTIHFFDGTDARGHKLFPLMNRSANYDSTDPGIKIPPSDTARIKAFLYHRWYDAATIDWSYAPELSLQRIWPLTEDLSYENPTLTDAGMDAFPLGDLYHWWQEDYTRWGLQQDEENTRILQWLETGLDPGTVSVEELEGSKALTNFTLTQNYPNPFNPTTAIRYQLSAVSDVKLIVYDILGREVTVLVNERKPPGRFEVEFNAAGLASGVYLYKLTAGNFVQVRKMVLVR